MDWLRWGAALIGSGGMKLPKELEGFIQDGHGTFYCEDGDWDLALVPAEKSDFSKELPKGSMMIAENGSGDCLFLKEKASGKSQVFVYWHEEGRAEVFAPTLQGLIESSAESREQKAAPARKGKKVSVKELEKASGNPKGLYENLKAFKAGALDVEALPFLRKALLSDDVQVAIEAAECIGKLGPAAREAAEGGGGAEDLETELFVTGSKVWSYSLYCNCYSACLEALRRMEADEDLIVEYVAHNIGAENPDDLLESLRALQAIGTKQAKRLMKRAVTFWEGELNVRQRQELKKILKG
jgi:hypothetical protein